MAPPSLKYEVPLKTDYGRQFLCSVYVPTEVLESTITFECELLSEALRPTFEMPELGEDNDGYY
jgi:hypothetical protein